MWWWWLLAYEKAQDERDRWQHDQQGVLHRHALALRAVVVLARHALLMLVLPNGDPVGHASAARVQRGEGAVLADTGRDQQPGADVQLALGDLLDGSVLVQLTQRDRYQCRVGRGIPRSRGRLGVGAERRERYHQKYCDPISHAPEGR